MLSIVGLIGVEVNGCVELPIRVYKLVGFTCGEIEKGGCWRVGLP